MASRSKCWYCGGMRQLKTIICVIFLTAGIAHAAPNPFPVDPAPGPTLIPTTPTIGFAQSSMDTAEGRGPAQVAVTLDQATSNQVSVFYKVSGTAMGNGDYQLQNGVLTFAPGQTRNTLTIPITNDTKAEGDETVTITLSDPQNAMLGQTLFTLTIHDNDPVPPS